MFERRREKKCRKMKEYEKKGNFKQALNYFKKVFDYKDYDYENGIKKSAQAAINRLSN